MPSSKMGLCKQKSWHILRGNTVATRVYQPDPVAMYQKLKDVCDRLEHLDPSWRLRRKDPVNVLPSQPGPSETIDVWLAIWHLGFTAESCTKGK